MAPRCPIATTYIIEMARGEGRGRFYILYELIFVFGLVAAALFGFALVPRLGWQSLFFLGGLPAILAVFLTRLLPESPRWLASQGPARRGRRHRQPHRTANRGLGQSAAAARARGAAASAGRQPLAGNARPRLSPPHARRLGDVVLLLLDHLRAQHLDADALQDHFQPAAVAGLGLRLDRPGRRHPRRDAVRL